MSGEDDREGDGGRPLPVVDPDGLAPDPERSGQRMAGVLLAAGLGTRFEGGNKLLATVDGEPIAARAARTLLDADLDAVVAVVGHEAGRVIRALEPVADGRLAVVGNPDYERGQSTSVRVGIRALCGADAAVFMLGDMPAVDPGSVDRLLAAYRAGAGDALAAAWKGQRGNPVLFDRQHFAALADLSGDVGGREILLDGDGSALVETGDPGVRRDVDRVHDLDEVGGDRD